MILQRLGEALSFLYFLHVIVSGFAKSTGKLYIL